MIVNKKINLRILGLDGNAFSLMGAFMRQARNEGWTQQEIDAVINECQSGNYSHLVSTLADHCVNPGLAPNHRNTEADYELH